MTLHAGEWGCFCVQDRAVIPRQSGFLSLLGEAFLTNRAVGITLRMILRKFVGL